MAELVPLPLDIQLAPGEVIIDQVNEPIVDLVYGFVPHLGLFGSASGTTTLLHQGAVTLTNRRIIFSCYQNEKTRQVVQHYSSAGITGFFECPAYETKGFLGGPYPYQAVILLPGGVCFSAQTERELPSMEQRRAVGQRLTALLNRALAVLGARADDASSLAVIRAAQAEVERRREE